MSSVEPSPLATLAARINAAHEEAQGTFRRSVQRALEAGELLLQAKASVGHGEWLRWLEANTCVPERTAQAYMRLARALPAMAPTESATVADLTLRETLAAVATHTGQLSRMPPDLSERALEDAVAGEKLSHTVSRAKTAVQLAAAPSNPSHTGAAPAWDTLNLITVRPPTEAEQALYRAVWRALAASVAQHPEIDPNIIREVLHAFVDGLTGDRDTWEDLLKDAFPDAGAKEEGEAHPFWRG